MDFLPTELLYLIMLQLPLKDAYYLSLTNSLFFNLYEDNMFWYYRLTNEFGHNVKPNELTWKTYYKQLARRTKVLLVENFYHYYHLCTFYHYFDATENDLRALNLIANHEYYITVNNDISEPYSNKIILDVDILTIFDIMLTCRYAVRPPIPEDAKYRFMVTTCQ